MKKVVCIDPKGMLELNKVYNAEDQFTSTYDIYDQKGEFLGTHYKSKFRDIKFTIDEVKLGDVFIDTWEEGEEFFYRVTEINKKNVILTISNHTYDRTDGQELEVKENELHTGWLTPVQKIKITLEK